MVNPLPHKPRALQCGVPPKNGPGPVPAEVISNGSLLREAPPP